MLNGIFKCIGEPPYNNYLVVIKVKETPKSYKMELLHNEDRIGFYTPAQLEMLFSKSSTIIIKKDNPEKHIYSPHRMPYITDDCFIIYPFQAGKPFRFDKVIDHDELLRYQK